MNELLYYSGAIYSFKIVSFSRLYMKNNIIKIGLIVLSIFCLVPSVQAQTDKFQKANKYYELYAFKEAIKHYEDALATSPNNYDAASRLAECYRQIGNLNKARQWYAKAIQFPNVDPVDIFYYGQVLRAEGRYSEAKSRFLEYAKTEPTLGNHYADACDYALANAAGNSTLSVTPVNNINSSSADFAPAFYKNKLLFSTFRKGNNNDSDAFNQLYISSRTGSQVGSPQPLRQSFQAIVNESNVSFSSDGRQVAYVKNNNNFTSGIIPLIGSGVKLDIYTADARSEKDWINEQTFPYNGRKYSNGYPHLSTDGNVLYFASDVPGGYGGFDIYACERTSSGWSEPINLGSEINTGGDEISPYIDNNTLYFSSNWHDGYGGLDVFKSDYINDEWKQAVNMGRGINSARDDYDFIFNEIEKIGYFTSNRMSSMGYDDIYRAGGSGIVSTTTTRPTTTTTTTIFDPTPIYTPTTSTTGTPTTNMLITLRDEVTQQALEGVKIDFTRCGGRTYTTDKNGTAILDYFDEGCTILISKNGYGETLHKLPMISRLDIGLTPTDGAFNGIVMDSESEARLGGVLVIATDKRTKSSLRASTDERGRYAIQLDPNSTYDISYSKSGYLSAVRNVNSSSTDRNLGFQEMELSPYFNPSNVVIVPPQAPTTAPPVSEIIIVEEPTRPSQPTIISTPVPTAPTYPTTTSSGDYEIQIGAFSKPKTEKFRHLEDLGRVYYDMRKGLAIHKVGTFTTRQDAERVRSIIASRGYREAFVRRISGSSSSVYSPPASTSSSSSGLVYKVQLGAFRNPSSAGFNPNLRNYGSIQQIPRADGITVFLLGDYYSMSEAIAAQENARNLGVSQAFVVKYRNGVKVK